MTNICTKFHVGNTTRLKENNVGIKREEGEQTMLIQINYKHNKTLLLRLQQLKIKI